jgi:polysaccharide biosynthesis protein PslH
VFGEHVEAHEIGLVRVRIVRDDGIVVGEVRHGGDGGHSMQRDQRSHEVPVEPVRKLVEVHVDLVGREHRPARLDSQVVDEMERLVLRTKAEHEVCDARNAVGHDDQGVSTVRDLRIASSRVNDTVVLVTPIAPACHSNGLAMRAGMLVDALRTAGRLDVVLVPIAGPPSPDALVVSPVAASDADGHVVAQLADSEWRGALERTAPLPRAVRLVPPTLAVEAQSKLDGARGATVVVLREYLVPFGLTLAAGLDAARIVVDLDDDVEPLLAALGEPDEAAAYGRLAREWLPRADAIAVASPDDAAAMAARYGLAEVHTIPNAYRAPRTTAPRPREDRILFVGNLTYRPNVDAARWLGDDVLPALRCSRPNATLDLIGTYDERLADLAARPGVRVLGHVDDVATHYARADVVVAPLRVGAGTRIKVLEAFAYRRPLVATLAAIAGLAVRDGDDVLVADDTDALATAVDRVLGDPLLADALTASAARVLERNYAPEVAGAAVRRVVFGEERDLP